MDDYGVQHLLFLVSAEFDETGNIKPEDKGVLEGIVETICRGNCTVRKTLFITEGTLASLETAHTLAGMLCDSNEATRQLSLGNDFWAIPHIGEIFSSIRQKVCHDEDLWVFVGAPQYIFKVVAIFLPDEYEIYDNFDNAPSAACIGITMTRKKLFRVDECHAETIVTVN